MSCKSRHHQMTGRGGFSGPARWPSCRLRENTFDTTFKVGLTGTMEKRILVVGTRMGKVV